MTSSALLAADQPAAKKDPVPAKDPAAEMAEWAKMNAPGPEHKRLEAFAGDWDCTCTMFMPDGSKMESKGKEKSKVIFGGRFIEGTFEGTMMGMPFTGKALMGYDNIKKCYINMWTDSTSTGIMMFEGKADAAGKVITMTCEHKEPDGKMVKCTSVTTNHDENTHTFDMYMTQPDGKEMKCMSIKYVRAK
jgi:hypothetical protein